MKRAKLTFQMQVDIEIVGKADGVRRADQKALFIHHAERKSGAVLHQVGAVVLRVRKWRRAGRRRMGSGAQPHM